MSSTPESEIERSSTRLSFRTKLVLGISALVLLTGGVLVALAQRSATASTEVLTDSLFKEVSGRIVTHTRAFVFRATPIVESLVQLADHGLVVDDPEQLAPQLLAVLKANPGLTWISYGDESGKFTGANRLSDGRLRINRSQVIDGKTKLVEHDVLSDGSWKVARSDDDYGYDPRRRPYYVKAKREGRLVWLPPYVFYNEGLPGISCAAPIKNQSGEIRGVLSADFDLNALSDFIASLSVSEHSRVFLFTTDRVLLAHPKGQVPAMAGNRENTKLLTLADAKDQFVDAFQTQLRPEFLHVGDDQSFHRFDFHCSGEDCFASTTTFRVGDDLEWVVGIAAPKKDFIGDVWRTQRVSLIAAGLALLVAMLLAFLLGSAVSRPISSLIGFMKRVGEGDLDTKAELGGSAEFRQLGNALNQMITDLRDRMRLRHSLGVAMEVQQRLLPAKPPQIQGLDIAGHSTYCDETGGDYYDFLVLDRAAPDAVLIALGDVMGHGVAAALVMAGVRAVLRDRAAVAGSLADLLCRLNRLISADHKGERFMTMHLSVIDAKNGSMRWASAGHDPAIIFDPQDQSFQEVGEGEMPLGVMDETEYTEQTFGPLRAGHVIFVGTDGVWEMPDIKGEQFGKDRLREVIRETANQPAAEIATAITDRLAKFQAGAKQVDDVTFLVVKVLE